MYEFIFDTFLTYHQTELYARWNTRVKFIRLLRKTITFIIAKKVVLAENGDAQRRI